MGHTRFICEKCKACACSYCFQGNKCRACGHPRKIRFDKPKSIKVK